MSSPSETLGKYQIIREIARSNDIVYEAYDPLMNRRVALKELNMPKGTSSQQRDERINRFKREARAAGTLAHPNIMTVYELGEEGDRFFIAMEFLDGCSLRTELDTKGTLPLDRALEIEIAILKGLEYAHSKGVIHRDIKPDNVQLLSDGRIKLTDFGIARLTFEPNLTMDGQVFGTPSYMSPEQVVGRDIDARSDLFSAGIVFYEMLSGKKPFTGDSVVSITHAIMNREPEPIQEANYAYWKVIERSLDKSPALRYSSAHEMIEALESAKVASVGPVIDTVQPIPVNSYAPSPYAPPPIPGAVPAPPPVMYSYNPYAPVQPPVYGQGVTGAPVNPYAGLPGTTQNYHPSSLNSQYVPNPTGLPVYYPSAPRQPLISAETKRAWSTIMLAFLVVGALFLLIFVLIKAFSASIQRTEMQEHDQRIVASLNSDVKDLPPSERLQRIEQVRPDLQSDLGKEQATRLEAQTEIKIGEQYFQIRDFAGAEEALRTAIELDPENADAHRDLATVYESIAQDQAYAQESALFWHKSVQTWIDAAHAERDPGRKVDFGENATKASIAYANKLMTTGDFEGAEQSLAQVKGLAKHGSRVEAELSRTLEQVRQHGRP